MLSRVLLGGMLWSSLLGAAALTTASAGCGGGKSAEICGTAEDEDQDGRAGCADDDCWVADGICSEICATIYDEDGDGFEGCDDSDCWVPGSECPEICSSESDEDGDGLVACADDDCWVQGGECPERCPPAGEVDEADEDGDGALGCDDPDCWLPQSGCPERCDSAFDEDADGATSCDDDDCLADPLCVPSFADDVQPIFLEHCWGDGGACHSDLNNLGGLSMDGYADMPLPSNYCGSNVTKGACALFRVLEPSMPADCLGCVPQEDIDVVQAWVDGGIPP